MRIPLVAIVGRPNVGKSTLFNRLTKSQDAIVDDVSGVTRDRLYGEVTWNSRMFRIIDTGGYVPDSEDRFETAIREQIDIAITEADAVIFVTDGRIGVTPSDEEFARILRTSKKPVYILVNKLDNETLALNASDFFRLGIEKVFDISALSGRKLGDFLDDIIASLDFPERDAAGNTQLRIALIGKPNVGKSSLANALLGMDRSIVTEIPGTTRDSIDSVLKYYGEEIVLVDTAGLRKRTKVKENIEFYSSVRTYRALADAHVSILLIDAESGIENQDQRIIDEAVRRRKGLIIAVNKWDLIEKDTMTSKRYEDAIKHKLGRTDYVPVVFISALTKQRIFKLIDLAKQIEEERKKKIPTSLLNEIILKDIERTPPPSTPTGREIKIKYATQVGDKYPIFLFFTNESKHIPDSYRRFLEKQIRNRFGFHGVPITVSFKDKNPSPEI